MPFPRLPRPPHGEVLLVCARYEKGKPFWGGLLGRIGGVREGDALIPPGGGTLRLVEGRSWDGLHGGHLPALIPGGGPVPSVAVLADTNSAYGGDGPLLVDLAVIPGRGVRVPPARLGGILAALLDGTLGFGDLVDGRDRRGVYEGDAGRPVPAATAPPGRTFPALPRVDGALLVRTSFDDEGGWRDLLAELGGTDENDCVGAEPDLDEFDADRVPLEALIVGDRAFTDLRPDEVPALVPPGGHPTLVALADARTFTEPGRPLTVVDLYDAPGHSARLPSRMVGSMVCNLEIANMDFFEFVPWDGVSPWWEE